MATVRVKKAEIARQALDQAQCLMLKLMDGQPLSEPDMQAYNHAATSFVRNWRPPPKRDESRWLTDREVACLQKRL